MGFEATLNKFIKYFFNSLLYIIDMSNDTFIAATETIKALDRTTLDIMRETNLDNKKVEDTLNTINVITNDVKVCEQVLKKNNINIFSCFPCLKKRLK